MGELVVAHDPDWARKFEREAEVVRAALRPAALAIHHIGSTAIPGIDAKPIVDMLVEAASLAAVDRAVARLAAEGYEAKGEFGLPGRRYFRKENAAGAREYHVHAYAAGSAEVERHLAFRDFLRSHAHVAREYCELKRRLVRENGANGRAYQEGKEPFVNATQNVALAWARRGRHVGNGAGQPRAAIDPEPAWRVE